ncbi:MAG: family 43 glycosylhydrolase [Bacteroidaceae bacterium]|nr:family 43 glycosylhydrolase [Bacteroidaceae bacterium]
MVLAVVQLSALSSQLSSARAETFKNPIIAEDAPDPSIIKGSDGYYYLFSTAERVFRSTDMVNWQYLRQVFDGGKRPTFVEGVKAYWAPCVTKQDGRYVLYFALSKWGGEDTASIGVATATKPEGPYTIAGEEGKLFTSKEIGVQNSIDPNYIEDGGKKYIVWGSWHGIWLIELTEDGLAVKNVRRKRQIAGTRFEAPYIYKRGKYYYLFCSIGACCEGARSTYETVVGRATSLFGPYFAKNGGRMLDNDCTIFLTSNEPCIAPGHNSRIIEDEDGRTWMTYHGYLRSDPGRGRVAWMDEVKWGEDGWPYIDGTGASATETPAPVVSR